MGKNDLEDLMLNRWFEKLCKKIGYDLISVSSRIFKFK